MNFLFNSVIKIIFDISLFLVSRLSHETKNITFVNLCFLLSFCLYWRRTYVLLEDTGEPFKKTRTAGP